MWVADDDPGKIIKLERMPMMQYWYLLNNKKAQVRNAAERAKKAKERSKTKRGR